MVLLTFLLICCVMIQREGIMQDVYTFAGTDQFQLPEYGTYSYICKSTSRTICFELIHVFSNSFDFAQRNLFLSSDIELHPGPSDMDTVLSENKVLNETRPCCQILYLSPVKRICVFEHSVTTSFNCACPAIQRGQGSGFLSEGSS